MNRDAQLLQAVLEQNAKSDAAELKLLRFRLIFGSSAFIIAVDFARPACAAFAKHQRTTVTTEQLSGEQVIILCLSPGRGFLVFGDLLLHILKQFQRNDGRDSIRHDHIPEFQFSDVPPVFENMFDTVISERTAHRVLDAVLKMQMLWMQSARNIRQGH